MGLLRYISSDYLLVVFRIFLMASKLVYVAFIGNFISAEPLSNLLWVTAFVGYFVGLGSLEYHYSIVREVKFGQTGFESRSGKIVSGHFGSISSISVFSICLFLIIQYLTGFTLFTDHLNNRLHIALIMLIVYCEIINTDQYRYFQVNDKKSQILSLFTRNFMPILLHAGFVYFGKFDDVVLSYLVLTLSFSFLGTFVWGLYSGDLRGNILFFRLPSIGRLMRSRYAIVLVACSSAYLQLDKIILINFLGDVEYVKYSIFCMIGLASLVVVQVLLIQPSLKAWYGQKVIGAFSFALLGQALFLQLTCLVAILSGLSLLNTLLPDAFEVTFFSVTVLFGFTFYGVSSVLSAYMYAAKFDGPSIRIELSVLLVSYLFLLSVVYLELPKLHFFPLVFGLASLLFRGVFVYRCELKSSS